MKKVLTALFALLALASCKKEAPEPQNEGRRQAPAKDEFVRLDLEGVLPSAKTLTFTSETNNQGKQILVPAFDGQSTVKAHYYIYDNDGNSVHDVVDIKVLNNGKSFSYEKENINVGSVGTPRYLSVYLGLL